MSIPWTRQLVQPNDGAGTYIKDMKRIAYPIALFSRVSKIVVGKVVIGKVFEDVDGFYNKTKLERWINKMNASFFPLTASSR